MHTDIQTDRKETVDKPKSVMIPILYHIILLFLPHLAAVVSATVTCSLLQIQLLPIVCMLSVGLIET